MSAMPAARRRWPMLRDLRGEPVRGLVRREDHLAA